jgi:hypothetical protein
MISDGAKWALANKTNKHKTFLGILGRQYPRQNLQRVQISVVHDHEQVIEFANTKKILFSPAC